MAAKMSVLGLILSFYPYLRSAMVQFPLLIITSHFFQLTISLHNVKQRIVSKTKKKQSWIEVGGPTLPSQPNAITWLLLAYHHWAMLLPTPIRACRIWLPKHFTCYHAATPPATAPAYAVTCRRCWKSPLDCATDLLSQIWQHITTVSFVWAFIFVYREAQKRL